MKPTEGAKVWLSGQSKIGPSHLDRLACIYIRQSSLKQVQHNRESQLNQYQLAQQAQALGWSKERIRVIDADQGLSGRDSHHRPGFKELVAEVSLGQVGIVFGYEVSRLARNNRDWYHLMDIAAMFGTLIGDGDGIYDPNLYNDRLLLGLKGTMSEAELHLLHQRLTAGRLSQVRRGVYRQNLPTGLVRQLDGSVVKDPDEQVRHSLELVLAKFAELGSCHQVRRYLHQHQIRLPRRQVVGLDKGQVIWKPATAAAIYEIVRNPAYAGAFVYGRRQKQARLGQTVQPEAQTVKKPMADWLHIEQGVYPAYLSWDQFLANQTKLNHNGSHFNPLRAGVQGASREGQALLQGIVRCGQCGAAMYVTYKPTPRYICQNQLRKWGGAICMSVHGPAIDMVVEQAFFEALKPAQLDALAAVLELQQLERQQLDQQWQEQLKRAGYEAGLAQRQYQLVDPENRLVAAELERRWEEKLVQLQETQAAYAGFQQEMAIPPLSPRLQNQLRQMSAQLPQLWPELSPVQSKELLRTLIQQVILKRETPDRIAVKIVWVSGHYSLVYAQPPVQRHQDLSYYPALVSRIETLWQQGYSDEAIAETLTEEGFHSARLATMSASAVEDIRLSQGWHRPLAKSYRALSLDGYLTIRGLAERLGVRPTQLYHRFTQGGIDPRYFERHPQSKVYLIKDDPALIEQLKQCFSQNAEPKEVL